jgi:hypothetical protein
MKELNTDDLRGPGYWYLASPYSKYPGGIHEAAKEVCRAAAHLVQWGVNVLAPIALTHPIAIYGQLDPLDHKIWMPFDQPLMDGARGLIVCKMESWEDSFGVKEEIRIFTEAGKPVYGMEWPT